MLMGEWGGWRWMRAAFRLSATAVVTSAFFALWILGMLVVGWHRNTAVRWRSFHFRNWSRVLLRLLRIEVVDSGESPEPPFLLVSNHLSYIDIPVLASRVDAFFVAKSEIAHWPVVGTLCRAMGTIFVDRESRRDVVRVLSELDQRLTEGHGVVLFPEGTSTDDRWLARASLSAVAPRCRRAPRAPGDLCERALRNSAGGRAGLRGGMLVGRDDLRTARLGDDGPAWVSSAPQFRRRENSSQGSKGTCDPVPRRCSRLVADFGCHLLMSMTADSKPTCR